MNKFYFQRRQTGLRPDKTKYYFSSIEELLNKVEILKDSTSRKNFIQWSIHKSKDENEYSLIREYWSFENRGTETPLKCKGWWVHGYIHIDETQEDINNLFPTWKSDYTNHFIETRYLSLKDIESLSDLDKEKLERDGGIILNKAEL